ncbi:MAG: hypothetical protein ACYDG2_03450 [Ruminiclostridium sp.]
MNCHGNNNSDGNRKEKGHKGHLSHMLMMALCCGAPIIILLLVPFLIKNGASGLAKPLAVIAPFICPLMMVFMIPMMFRGRKDKANNNKSHQNENLQLNQKTQEE